MGGAGVQPGGACVLDHRFDVVLIGVESEAVGSSGDRLYFDEECFLRGTGGRFQVDSLVPISGRAVVTGASGDGTTLRDAATDVESLRARIKYL